MVPAEVDVLYISIRFFDDGGGFKVVRPCLVRERLHADTACLLVHKVGEAPPAQGRREAAHGSERCEHASEVRCRRKGKRTRLPKGRGAFRIAAAGRRGNTRQGVQQLTRAVPADASRGVLRNQGKGAYQIQGHEARGQEESAERNHLRRDDTAGWHDDEDGLPEDTAPRKGHCRGQGGDARDGVLHEQLRVERVHGRGAVQGEMGGGTPLQGTQADTSAPVVLRREPECGGMADMGRDAHASRPALHQMEEHGGFLLYAIRGDNQEHNLAEAFSRGGDQLLLHSTRPI